ncbi:hypothetical protein CC86DRAFT_422248 [Ophiobolus disseminans]|uniref:Uncharacterized protein n=1 Tax=Ophiobolus disseminans TaxID=1469910 RepID=A0A6A6ZQM8_9PLEO|nr:hypothetical protein CC86DRAFT_422248 [Ophiobolus disseminans]
MLTPGPEVEPCIFTFQLHSAPPLCCEKYDAAAMRSEFTWHGMQTYGQRAQQERTSSVTSMTRTGSTASLASISSTTSATSMIALPSMATTSISSKRMMSIDDMLNPLPNTSSAPRPASTPSISTSNSASTSSDDDDSFQPGKTITSTEYGEEGDRIAVPYRGVWYPKFPGDRWA